VLTVETIRNGGKLRAERSVKLRARVCTQLSCTQLVTYFWFYYY